MSPVTALRDHIEGGALEGYDAEQFFCELSQRGDATCRELDWIWERLKRSQTGDLAIRDREADTELFNLGVTFTVYSEKDVVDRVLPFDIIPRIILADEWREIETGVIQRVTAINAFLYDIYHKQHILNDGTVPAELVVNNKNFRPEMQGFAPTHKNYVHVCGTDIIRDDDGKLLVLEDNARSPSGVSYVVENRHLMRRYFADLMQGINVRSVSDYGRMLHDKLCESAPGTPDDPRVVLLSPGMFNSAYFEHIFLAREMGVPVVEGRDLVVENDRVFMKTVSGLHVVDVIYRRIDDDFLDPKTFRKDSFLGVPGLVDAMKKGSVTLANAIGTGVADDKAVYAYLPRIIKYYLDEEPILSNVETNICREDEGLSYTLAHLKDLVIKPVGESGGYGITIGPKASKEELEKARAEIKADPSNYVSQPMISLSVCPTLTDDGLRPRHVDLRPFAVTGETTSVLPGGLTRVALTDGSIIVNSSQGGGTKDTWVLEDGGA